jgi:hypothetical protein
MIGDIVGVAVGRTVVTADSGVSVTATKAAAELQLARTNAGNSSNAIHHMYLLSFNTLSFASISLF